MSSSSAFEVRVPYALTTYFGYDAGLAASGSCVGSCTAMRCLRFGQRANIAANATKDRRSSLGQIAAIEAAFVRIADYRLKFVVGANYDETASVRRVEHIVHSISDSPFNNLIPNRRLTGCVGVAMAIIMRHHKYPAQGTGSIGPQLMWKYVSEPRISYPSHTNAWPTDTS